MRSPRFPGAASGSKTSCACIANNDPSGAGLQDDLLSRYRQLPAEANEEAEMPDHVPPSGVDGVERVGAKRRRTASRYRWARGRRGEQVSGERPDGAAMANTASDDGRRREASDGPANRARNEAQGAVAADDDDDEEVTAVFTGRAGDDAVASGLVDDAAAAALGAHAPEAGRTATPMTAGQIRNVQARTYNLLMNFWARRREDNTRGEPSEQL